VTGSVVVRQSTASQRGRLVFDQARTKMGEGLATYIGIGASNVSGHHTSRFDLDESALHVGDKAVVNSFTRLSEADAKT